MRLQGKVAFVTGASSGIGKAAAIRLAEEGAKVLLADMKESRGEAVLKQIEEAGGEGILCDMDLREESEVQAAMQEAVERWGRIDIVFANAGINGVMAPIELMKAEDWDDTLTTNLRGTFFTLKSAIPYLKKQGGSVIITSSINGNRTFSGFGFCAYSTSKAGQMAFGKMAALELAQYKIRVNVICPGAIDTNIGESTHPTPELKEIQIPVEYPEGDKPLEGKAGKAKQVADLVLFLASEESNHITGTEIYIDGAESLLR